MKVPSPKITFLDPTKSLLEKTTQQILLYSAIFLSITHYFIDLSSNLLRKVPPHCHNIYLCLLLPWILFFSWVSTNSASISLHQHLPSTTLSSFRDQKYLRVFSSADLQTSLSASPLVFTIIFISKRFDSTSIIADPSHPSSPSCRPLLGTVHFTSGSPPLVKSHPRRYFPA